jgi:hypothetical protein
MEMNPDYRTIIYEGKDLPYKSKEAALAEISKLELASPPWCVVACVGGYCIINMETLK